jgi:hypothetical protein
MKRFIILVSFLFISFVGLSQGNQYEAQMRQEVAYTQWKQEYATQNCQPSFYWLITRSPGTDGYGRYLYKFYFYSNSRYCNGAWAGTYITGIYLVVDGYALNPTAPYWIMFKETYQPPALSFWSANYNPSIRFTWGNAVLN